MSQARDYECTGEGANGDHCCYLGNKPCPHLLENVAGRRYACGLMVKYGGDWDRMMASPEYEPIGKYWEKHTAPYVTFTYCRDFDPAFCCRPEYRKGRKTEDEVI